MIKTSSQHSVGTSVLSEKLGADPPCRQPQEVCCGTGAQVAIEAWWPGVLGRPESCMLWRWQWSCRVPRWRLVLANTRGNTPPLAMKREGWGQQVGASETQIGWTPCVVACFAPSSSFQGGRCVAGEGNPFSLERQGSSARAEAWSWVVSEGVCGPGDLWTQWIQGLGWGRCLKFCDTLEGKARSACSFMTNSKPGVAGRFLISAIHSIRVFLVGLWFLALVNKPNFSVLFRRHHDFPVPVWDEA